MHGMIRGTSISSAHACSGDAGTSNEFSSFTYAAASMAAVIARLASTCAKCTRYSPDA
jgi:hypothetical protein